MDKKRIHEMLEILTETALCELNKGTECVCTEEMGQVIDMIKDLAEAEKNVWEKCYWKELAEGFEEEDELQNLMMKYGRAGYDRWRTASGRFAPKGTGHETSMAMATGRAGFDPRTPEGMPWYVDPWMAAMGCIPNDRDPQRFAGERSSARHDVRNDSTGRMGYTPDEWSSRQTPYEKYKEARRHYQDTKAPEHKQEMTDRAKEYVEESIGTIRDIFAESDPQLQQKMKSDLTNLCREFGITK